MKKLRNKKTNDIIDLNEWTIQSGYLYITISNDNDSTLFYKYESLAELNKEWEDYIPKEPLIKDEKVQKAIRVFCEVTQEKKRIFVIKQFGRGSAEFSVGGRYAIRLPLSYESMDALEDGRNYTLTELCGEEE